MSVLLLGAWARRHGQRLCIAELFCVGDYEEKLLLSRSLFGGKIDMSFQFHRPVCFLFSFCSHE